MGSLGHESTGGSRFVAHRKGEREDE
jgi:hypothetical protein